MPLALCRCKAADSTDIDTYFKELATKQMREDNGKQYPNWGYYIIILHIDYHADLQYYVSHH